jgi:hypothetical protein
MQQMRKGKTKSQQLTSGTRTGDKDEKYQTKRQWSEQL